MSLLFLNIGSFEMILLLIPFFLYLYTFFTVAVHESLTSNERLLWIIVFLVFNILGTIAYWIWRNNSNSISSSR